MNKLLFSSVLATSLTVSFTATAQMSCNDVLMNISFGSETRRMQYNLEREQREFIEKIIMIQKKPRRETEGISLSLPVGVEAEFTLRNNPQQIRRGLFLKRSKIGIEEIVQFNERMSDRLLTTMRPISIFDIAPESIKLRVTINEAEARKTAATLLSSVTADEHVSFLQQDNNGQIRLVSGQVKNIKVGDGLLGTTKSATMLFQPNGSDSAYLTNTSRIVPGSVQRFKVQKRTLSPDEQKTEAQLDQAFANKSYVTLSIKSQSANPDSRIEGWITGKSLTTDGDVIFSFSQEMAEPERNGFRISIAKIVRDSFTDRPSLNASSLMSLEKSPNAPVLHAIVESPSAKKVQQVTLIQPSARLFSELSVFAESNLISGQSLPKELENEIRPGSEMRLYFKNKAHTIRLTIRRSTDGTWSFGNTAWDLLMVDEAYINERYQVRYSLNEKMSLEDKRFQKDLPASRLREHLRQIRYFFQVRQAPAQFAELKELWNLSIPEFTSNPSALALMEYATGVHFYLDKGFIKETTQTLNAEQSKLLAAIQYLNQNNLIFWSTNAVQKDPILRELYPHNIYPRNTWSPDGLNLGGIDYAFQLVRALEKSGLKYENGTWVKH